METYDLYDILGNFLGSVIAEKFAVVQSRNIDSQHLTFYRNGEIIAIFVETMIGIAKITHTSKDGFITTDFTL